MEAGIRIEAGCSHCNTRYHLLAVIPLNKRIVYLGRKQPGEESILGSNGRCGAEADGVVVRDTSVADRHALIFREAGRDVVEDLGSPEGTFVSYTGEPGQERRIFTKNALRDGSYIRLGKSPPIIFRTKPRSLVVQYKLRSDKVNIIGRDLGYDIVLDDPLVSKKHAQIVWEAGTFVVEDLGSDQGTFVRYGGESSPERRVTGRNAIKDGSVIRVGNVLLVLEAEKVGIP